MDKSCVSHRSDGGPADGWLKVGPWDRREGRPWEMAIGERGGHREN